MDVRLPKLGEGAESGTVVSIMVKEGDTIATGQTILELENEKAVAPIPSTASGRVRKIRVKEGDKISAGQVILSIDTGGAGLKPAADQSADATPLPTKPKPVAAHEREAEAIEGTEQGSDKSAAG